jgi:PRTRC genetic system protein E
MNLFKSVEKHLDSVNVSIVITKNGDKISVSFLPQLKSEDKSKKEMVPLMLKGTAAELDAEFVTIISSPLEKVSGIASNLIQFEAKVKKMEESTKLAEEKKKAKVEDDKKAEKKLETAQKWFDKNDMKKALKYTDEALAISDGNEKCLALLKLIQEKDPTLELKVPEIKEADASGKTETVKPESVNEAVKEVFAPAPKNPDFTGEDIVTREPTSMKEVAPEKQQEAEEVKAEESEAEFTEFDSIEELENKVTKRPEVKKSKEQLDIECNAFVDQALPLASAKKYDEAKALLEKGLEIQPKHQRALGALGKVEGWIAEIENSTPAAEEVVKVVEKEEVSLVGTPKPTRKDMESMEDFLAREKAWEEVNSPFKEDEEVKSESQLKEDAFNAEKPDENSNPSTNASQPEEDDDEF